MRILLLPVHVFQFFQSKNGNVELRIVKNNAYEHCEEEIRQVENKMKALFEVHCKFNTVAVERIDHDRGKHRYILREQ